VTPSSKTRRGAGFRRASAAADETVVNTSESIDNKNTDPHELVVRHEAQLGILYSPVSRWAATSSSR
jgi:hypothetical protein